MHNTLAYVPDNLWTTIEGLFARHDCEVLESTVTTMFLAHKKWI